MKLTNSKMATFEGEKKLNQYHNHLRANILQTKPSIITPKPKFTDINLSECILICSNHIKRK